MSHHVSKTCRCGLPFLRYLLSIISSKFFARMSFVRRVLVWLALFGMALHAPLPAMAHEQQAEWLAVHAVCSASGKPIAGMDAQAPDGQNHSGANHVGMLCCLFCSDVGTLHAAPPVTWAFIAQRGLQFAVPLLSSSAFYRHSRRFLAPARAPPVA
ncbi:DUF2946 domain-containing protein [Ralstonia sp. SET104]|uniref:DUF2946 domain-containing protein n=1 Tax=Ralstonia sp. SET104 TaxID=2448774 RepID=UPI0021A97A24|nr:DUF2946 domain-containing protein [Ralstonia sp. SET104]